MSNNILFNLKATLTARGIFCGWYGFLGFFFFNGLITHRSSCKMSTPCCSHAQISPADLLHTPPSWFYFFDQSLHSTPSSLQHVHQLRPHCQLITGLQPSEQATDLMSAVTSHPDCALSFTWNQQLGNRADANKLSSVHGSSEHPILGAPATSGWAQDE